MRPVFYPIYDPNGGDDYGNLDIAFRVGAEFDTSTEGWREVNRLRESTGLPWRLAREIDDEVTIYLSNAHPDRLRQPAAKPAEPKQKTVRVLREWKDESK